MGAQAAGQVGDSPFTRDVVLSQRPQQGPAVINKVDPLPLGCCGRRAAHGSHASDTQHTHRDVGCVASEILPMAPGPTTQCPRSVRRCCAALVSVRPSVRFTGHAHLIIQVDDLLGLEIHRLHRRRLLACVGSPCPPQPLQTPPGQPPRRELCGDRLRLQRVERHLSTALVGGGTWGRFCFSSCVFLSLLVGVFCFSFSSVVVVFLPGSCRSAAGAAR